ncbi:RNA polymerase subunit sigma-70 [Actinoallomurus rhizosphaericola]|uniref:RNA polymerase subunit sigma-70 n=1 Tax=Actinoallomurus rhizosphaericola TaxID=2952536 RepID=UPI002092B1CA|nr:RNA polymerase subunit sigma-70 [Actinoallomurus rhizosphaericola]MCO5994809.1 RNA polymerase subunit sigma-70 [Actinoallomurus rhizosphaericola]
MTSELRAAPHHDRFTAETEQFRRELLAHCYRMVGSAYDAEDLVQESYLRAWRSYSGFEGRASIRSWLYKIATNVCLKALQPRSIRVLPSGLAGPYDGPDRPPSPLAPGEVAWLEPLPDAWIAPPADDPAAVVIERESLRLALIAGLQHLPARQRAILILREVLAFSTAETAEILDTTTAAVKSGLQRARARLDEVEPKPEELLEPTDQRARALLDGYIAAFERSDAGLLEQVLRADATLEATPFREWQAGRARCIHTLDAYVLGTPGDWRMIATAANGQPAAVVYHRDADGVLRADGAVVLAPTAAGVSRVIKFHDPALVAAFGLPDVLPR